MTAEKDILLLGAGYAHLLALQDHARAPWPHARLTLVTPEAKTPYSGMLSGYIAGLYTAEDIHIDIAGLAARAGVRLIIARAIAIDRAARRVWLDRGDALSYDLLSLNLGVTSDATALPGALDHAIGLKPIPAFLDAFETIRTRARRGSFRLALIGGGMAGAEMMLAIAGRLGKDRIESGTGLSFSLIAGGSLVPSRAPSLRRRLARALIAQGVALIEERAVRLEQDSILLESGKTLAADTVLLATGGRVDPILSRSGLATATDGALLIRPTLQARDDASIFAAGDCAHMEGFMHEKAGVFAVRQGPVLAGNLVRALQGQALLSYRPQRRFLSLITVPERRAIAVYGRQALFSGRLAFSLKDRIDRAFMARFAGSRHEYPPRLG